MRPWACCLGLQMSPCRVVTSADDGARSHYRSGRSIGFYGVLRMVRELFYAAALLVPGLAYAGNPSADLSVQIVPAVPQVPAGAQAAGFTTLAANYDFSQPKYASQSNYLTCGVLSSNAGSVTTDFWQEVDGNGL